MAEVGGGHIAQAGAEAAAHDQHQDRGQGAHPGVPEAEQVRDAGGEGGSRDHADDQAGVLGSGKPESSLVAVGDADDRGDRDHQVD